MRAAHSITAEVQWMTAGRGIIHSENVRTKGKVRLLQLWLTLPKNKRWIAPDFQTINVNEVPVRRENGTEIRVYSGSSVGLQSGTRNHVPVTMVEINLGLATRLGRVGHSCIPQRLCICH